MRSSWRVVEVEFHDSAGESYRDLYGPFRNPETARGFMRELELSLETQSNDQGEFVIISSQPAYSPQVGRASELIKSFLDENYVPKAVAR